jgi:hypothetical protein
MPAWESLYGPWSDWRQKGNRKGWFEDLFAIWQKEHGIRIRAREVLPTGGAQGKGFKGLVTRFVRSLVGVERAPKNGPTPRFLPWLMDQRGLESDWPLRR